MQKYIPAAAIIVVFSMLMTGCANTGTTKTVSNTANAQENQTASPQNTTVNKTPGSSNQTDGSTSTSSQTGKKPHQPQHIVVVVEENHGYQRIVGNTQAPYINSLIQNGALFTNYHAVAHPSQPNYLALFAGSTLGIHSDSCPHSFSQANLGSELIAHHFTFTGYSESLPKAGYEGCGTRTYARKHAPWVNFTNLPARVNQPFAKFPKDVGRLPDISFVIPNVKNDMHSGSISAGDTWLKRNLGSYIQWAKGHNSLLMITFDEGYSQNNRVATVFYGAGVKSGHYSQQFSHYSLLRTIESIYQLPELGQSEQAKPMTIALSY